MGRSLGPTCNLEHGTMDKCNKYGTVKECVSSVWQRAGLHSYRPYAVVTGVPTKTVINSSTGSYIGKHWMQ